MKKTKEYLNQLYFINEEITQLKDTLEEVKRRSVSLRSPSLKGTGGEKKHSSNAKYTEFIEKTIFLEKKIKEKTAEYLELYAEIRTIIFNVSNLESQWIIINRYLLFEKWRNIMKLLECSEKHSIRLHNKALADFKAQREKNTA